MFSVVRWKTADVSEEHVTSSFCLLPASCWFLDGFTLKPRRLRRRVPPKRRLTDGLHGVVSQNIELFSLMEVYRRFEGKCCVYFQVRTMIPVVLNEIPCNMVEFQIRSLKMEAPHSSKTPVNFYQTSRHYIPEDSSPAVRSWNLASDRVYHDCFSTQISFGQNRVGVRCGEVFVWYYHLSIRDKIELMAGNLNSFYIIRGPL
jgi:hypothetical protein